MRGAQFGYKKAPLARRLGTYGLLSRAAEKLDEFRAGIFDSAQGIAQSACFGFHITDRAKITAADVGSFKFGRFKLPAQRLQCLSWQGRFTESENVDRRIAQVRIGMYADVAFRQKRNSSDSLRRQRMVGVLQKR